MYQQQEECLIDDDEELFVWESLYLPADQSYHLNCPNNFKTGFIIVLDD